jgi:hypothetical protein
VKKFSHVEMQPHELAALTQSYSLSLSWLTGYLKMQPTVGITADLCKNIPFAVLLASTSN